MRIQDDYPLVDRLSRYDASAFASAILKRSLSVTEIVEAHFSRIEKLNKKYNAIVSIDKTRALQRAQEADHDLAQGKIWGPLHGVPITIKDSLETEGLRTTVGYAGRRDFVPSKDAWVVAKLKSAGAIVIGKTNCARLCCDIQTISDVFGATNNPWDINCTSGGSSGGEAVAVALAMSPLGIGSDTGGSIRIPSSYCGTFGLKTSSGKISTEGLHPIRDRVRKEVDSLTVVGPIARSVRDLILCYKVLSDEPDEPVSGRLKIYCSRELGGKAVDDEVIEHLSSKVSTLSSASIDVMNVDAPFATKKLAEIYFRLAMFEFAPKENNRLFHSLFWSSEVVRSMFRGGIGARYAELKQEQAALSKELEEFMKDCDCWVLPATPTVAFTHRKIGSPIPMTVKGRTQPHDYFSASQSYACPFNLLGNPCVVIPIGRSREGLPIAIQVVGKAGEDMKLLNAVSHLATELGVSNLAANTNHR